jgi:hypothetical protein
VLGEIERILDVDAKIPDGALDLGVSEQSCAIIRILLSH